MSILCQCYGKRPLRNLHLFIGPEDANSKLVEVVNVADDAAEKRVDDSLVRIWKVK